MISAVRVAALALLLAMPASVGDAQCATCPDEPPCFGLTSLQCALNMQADAARFDGDLAELVKTLATDDAMTAAQFETAVRRLRARALSQAQSTRTMLYEGLVR